MNYYGEEMGHFCEEYYNEPLYRAFSEYMAQEADKKKDNEKKEGDGRKGKSKDPQTGRWGHHEPVREKPKDRNKGQKPWRER